jgi:hypothetical protein
MMPAKFGFLPIGQGMTSPAIMLTPNPRAAKQRLGGTLSAAIASKARHEPDMQISTLRIRLSDKTSRLRPRTSLPSAVKRTSPGRAVGYHRAAEAAPSALFGL